MRLLVGSDDSVADGVTTLCVVFLREGFFSFLLLSDVTDDVECVKLDSPAEPTAVNAVRNADTEDDGSAGSEAACALTLLSVASSDGCAAGESAGTTDDATAAERNAETDDCAGAADGSGDCERGLAPREDPREELDRERLTGDGERLRTAAAAAAASCC